jgi:hypothetical protein
MKRMQRMKPFLKGVPDESMDRILESIGYLYKTLAMPLLME